MADVPDFTHGEPAPVPAPPGARSAHDVVVEDLYCEGEPDGVDAAIRRAA